MPGDDIKKVVIPVSLTVPFAHDLRAHLDRRELLLGTTAIATWATIPANAQFLAQNTGQPAPLPPIVALDPAADLGASGQDNISNDPLAPLLITVDSSIPVGAVIEILNNGSSYTKHTLTAAELSSGIVRDVGRPRQDGLHNINATLSVRGSTSALSNTLGYQLDTSISKPTLTGSARTSSGLATATVTFGTAKPQAGDVLVLVDAGNNNSALAEKVLATGDLGSTTISSPKLPIADYDLACYVYGTGNRFSPLSNTLSQAVGPANYIATTYQSTQTLQAPATRAQFDGFRIGKGIVLIGATCGYGPTQLSLTEVIVHVPNRASDPTGKPAMVQVTQSYIPYGKFTVAFYTFRNDGADAAQSCDIDLVFDGMMAVASATVWTMANAAGVAAYSTGASTNWPYANMKLSAFLSAGVPDGGAVFAIAQSGSQGKATWTGVDRPNINDDHLQVGSSFIHVDSLHKDIVVGANALTLTWVGVPTYHVDVMVTVSFAPNARPAL